MRFQRSMLTMRFRILVDMGEKGKQTNGVKTNLCILKRIQINFVDISIVYNGVNLKESIYRFSKGFSTFIIDRDVNNRRKN